MRPFTVGVLVSLALLVGLFLYLDLSPAEVWSALREAPPMGIAAVVGLHLFALIAKVRRWRLLLRGSGCEPPVGSDPSVDPALPHLVQDAVFLGWLGNLVLPVKSGEMVRPLLFSRRARMPFARILGTVVLERCVDLLVIAAGFWLAVAVTPVLSSLPPEVLATSRLAGFAAVALLVALGVLWKLGPPQSQATGAGEATPGGRLQELLATFRSGLAGFEEPKVLFGVLGWTALSWTIEVLGAWLCLAVFKVKLTAAWTAATVHVVATTLAVSVVPVPGGLGVEQPVTLAVFQPFADGSLPAESVIAVSLVLSLSSIFWVVPLGLLGMWRQGARLGPAGSAQDVELDAPVDGAS
jgi:uncharacterized protein (TIRG00374 family)